MKSFLQKTKSNFFTWFPWVFMIVSFLTTLIFMWTNGRYYIDSDMSAEMILADLLNEEGTIASKNWWYSTEIRIFYLQVVYRLTLLLFPNDWYSARMLGQAIWMIALLASYLYACGKNGLNLKNHGVWGAAALACPFSFRYFWYIWYGGSYVTHTLLTLFAFGLILHLVHDAPRWRHMVQTILLIAVGLVSGMEGVKKVMIFFFPVLLASILLIIVELHRAPKNFPTKSMKYVGFSTAALAASFVGLLINSKILAENYSFSSQERFWGPFNFTEVFGYWGKFLSLYGWQNSSFSILSVKGFLGVFAVLIMTGMLISLIRSVFRWREFSLDHLLVIILLFCALLTQSSIFAFTLGGAKSSEYLWLPIVPIGFIVMQIVCESESFRYEITRQLLGLLLLICIVGSSFSTIIAFFEQPERATPEFKAACDWLVENGYENGFVVNRDFWSAGILTEWTSGKLDVYVIDEGIPTVTKTFEWLQKKSHKVPPEGKIFILQSPYSNMISFYYFDHGSLVYQDEYGYVIYSYDSYDLLHEDVVKATGGTVQ